MGIGKINNFKSEKMEYESPSSLFQPLANEFNLKRDVCATKDNTKLPLYWTIEDDALIQEWKENCWMNPPFNKQLSKWVKKAHSEALNYNNTIVCLIPVRSNTKWWRDTIKDAEVRFIIGEVNFSNLKRGLWLPMCIVIFGNKAKIGCFSFINYK